MEPQMNELSYGTTDEPGAAFGRNQRVQGSGFWCEIEYGW